MPPTDAADARLAEANRQFTICNACRYCEDYCAVFPAMELRTAFRAGDVAYLANLCHDCRACYQACMYTEPHEFALDIPTLLAAERVESYRRYSRPRWLHGAFTAGPLALAALTVGVLAAFVAAYAAIGSLEGLVAARSGAGSFYAVVSHAAMAVPALLLSGFAVLVVGAAMREFWRDCGGRARDLLDLRSWRAALAEAGSLAWMRGGGGDCYYPEAQRPSPVRRRYHQLVMYGFLATFAATVSAFVAEYVFGRLPPYPLVSVPVMLGLVGGIAVVAGAAGLLVLKRQGARQLTTADAVAMDTAFLVALLAVAISGLALLALRESRAMGTLLLIHLATVAVLYLTAPYGKFVHAAYRLGAVLRSVHERQP